MKDNQIQQPQQNNPIEPTQPFLHRWIPAIVGIAIVVFVGGGVLAYQVWWGSSSTPPSERSLNGTAPAEFLDAGERTEVDKTLNWKTYRSEEFGFEIKYPGTIFVLDEETGVLSHALKNFRLRSAKDGTDVGVAKDITIAFTDDISKCLQFGGIKSGFA